MGNVLIIKNNNPASDIHMYAEESLLKRKGRFYNTNDGSPDEKYLKRNKEKFGEDGIVLLITYNGADENKIQDIFIGSDVKINEKNNVDYMMQIRLSGEKEGRAIASIVDKIDLDISKDFAPYCYVIMSDMESLYQELRERIISRNKKLELNTNKQVKEEENEVYQIEKYAQKDFQAKRVYKTDEAGKYRTDFQRDRERVVNCKAFRRMVDKAQIFSAEKGDYYRTRLTHSLEVNQIAKAIAYALNLNLDLTEAIALGHDLGHTPFGHQGERTLDEILSGKTDVGIVAPEKLLEERCFGGFKHNYQSARILTQIEEKYVDFPGLNVSVQVVEGVLKHTKMNPDIPISDFLKEPYTEEISIVEKEKKQICATLEGQTVAIADEIAQRGHDVDDALTSGVMSIEEFIDRLKISKCGKLREKIQKEIENVDTSDRALVDKKELKVARIVSCIISYMINATIEYSRQNLAKEDIEEITMRNTKEFIGFSEEVSRINSYLERVVQKKVICNSEVARADYNANMIVKTLFEKYYANPRLLHAGTVHKVFVETLRHTDERVSNSAVNLNDGSIEIVNNEIEQLTKEMFDEEMIKSYIEGNELPNSEKHIVIFEKRKILIRCIIDYIAGMTDGYAIEEYERLK